MTVYFGSLLEERLDIMNVSQFIAVQDKRKKALTFLERQKDRESLVESTSVSSHHRHLKAS
jgi:hypothetical protein